ncbi:MAG: tetratricopeptide repeat protein [Acidobacteriia bacterium]|nr:tetratricopeptide repeat protein [Terriglobia bacterium]
MRRTERQLLFTIGIAAAIFAAKGLRGQALVWQQLYDAGQGAFYQGDLAKAESQWVEAFGEAKRIGVQSPQFLATQRSLASLFLLWWRLDEARAWLAATEKTMKERGQDAGADLDVRLMAGQVNTAVSDLGEAARDLGTALKLSEKLGNDHPSTAAVLLALGELRFQQDALAESAEHLRRAAGIYRETFGPIHPGTVEARSRLSQVLLVLGQYPEAADQARLAAEAAEKLGAAGRIVRGDALLAWALADASIGRQQDASAKLVSALNQATATYGEQSLRIVPYLTASAELALSLGDTSKAADFIARALSVCKSDALPDWLPMADALRVASKIAIRQSKLKDAAAAIDQARAIAAKRLMPDSLLMADVLEIRGDMRLASREVEGADADYRQSLVIREKQLPKSHPAQARSIVNLARVFQFSGKPETADALYARAIQMLESAWGTDSANLIPTLESYVSCLRLQKRDSEAQAAEKRIEQLRARH